MGHFAKSCVNRYTTLQASHPQVWDALSDTFRRRYTIEVNRLRMNSANARRKRSTRDAAPNAAPNAVPSPTSNPGDPQAAAALPEDPTRKKQRARVPVVPSGPPPQDMVRFGQKILKAATKPKSSLPDSAFGRSDHPPPQHAVGSRGLYRSWPYQLGLITKPSVHKAAKCNLCDVYFLTAADSHNKNLRKHCETHHHVFATTPPAVINSMLKRKASTPGMESGGAGAGAGAGAETGGAAGHDVGSSPKLPLAPLSMTDGVPMEGLQGYLGLTRKATNPEQMAFMDSLFRAVLSANLSLNILSNPDFRLMILRGGPRAAIPSPETFRTRVLADRWGEHIETTARLTEGADAITVMCDGWTDRNLTRYVGIAMCVTTLCDAGITRVVVPVDAPPLQTVSENSTTVAQHIADSLAVLRVPEKKVFAYMSDSATPALNVGLDLHTFHDYPLVLADNVELDGQKTLRRCAVHQVALVAKGSIALDCIADVLDRSKAIYRVFALGSKAKQSALLMETVLQQVVNVEREFKDILGGMREYLLSRKRAMAALVDPDTSADEVTVTEDELLGTLGQATAMAAHADSTTVGAATSDCVRQRQFSIVNMVTTRFASMHNLFASVHKHGAVLMTMTAFEPDLPVIDADFLRDVLALKDVTAPLYHLCARLSADDLLVSQLPGALTDTKRAILDAASAHSGCDVAKAFSDAVCIDLMKRFPFLADAEASPLHLLACIIDPSCWRKVRVRQRDGAMSDVPYWTPYWWVPGYQADGLEGIKPAVTAAVQAAVRLRANSVPQGGGGASRDVFGFEEDDVTPAPQNLAASTARKTLTELIRDINCEFSHCDEKECLPTATVFWTKANRTKYSGLIDDKCLAFIVNLVAHTITVERLFSRLKQVDHPQRQHRPGMLNKRGVLMASLQSGSGTSGATGTAASTAPGPGVVDLSYHTDDDEGPRANRQFGAVDDDDDDDDDDDE